MKVWNVFPELPLPPTLDLSGRLAWLALEGYTQLAADTLLTNEMRGRLETVVGNSVRQLNSEFISNKVSRGKCYVALIEIALNLTGMERKRAGFSKQESEASLKDVVEALKVWEATERSDSPTLAVEEVIRGLVSAKKKVLFGRGMVSQFSSENRSLQFHRAPDPCCLCGPEDEGKRLY
jgi:hypothetical protein